MYRSSHGLLQTRELWTGKIYLTLKKKRKLFLLLNMLYAVEAPKIEVPVHVNVTLGKELERTSHKRVGVRPSM